jgi:hypothetical protein
MEVLPMMMENVSGQEAIPDDDVRLSRNKRLAIVTFEKTVDGKIVDYYFSSCLTSECCDMKF